MRFGLCARSQRHVGLFVSVDMQALFDRVVDISNMHVVLNSLDDPIGKEAIDVFNVELLRERNRCRLLLAARVGWLNIWTPNEAEGFYDLELSRRDERIVADFLVKLAVIEPGENWTGETLNGTPWELSQGWISEVPTRGRVTLTYVADQKAKTREKLHTLTLGSSDSGGGSADEASVARMMRDLDAQMMGADLSQPL